MVTQWEASEIETLLCRLLLVVEFPDDHMSSSGWKAYKNEDVVTPIPRGSIRNVPPHLSGVRCPAMPEQQQTQQQGTDKVQREIKKSLVSQQEGR